jgi:membrane protease YdiL (CAAX protease family)
MIPPKRLVAITLGTQAALTGAAALGMWAFDVPPAWGRPADVPIGLGAALALAGLNLWMLRHAPTNWVVSSVRRIYGDVLVPLFAPLGPRVAVFVGLSAGVGEELFFRGLLQPLVGVTLASLLFGLAHVAGRGMVGFGIWATLMGAALGGLAVATGGLIAPMIAHGAYDALALTYIRRTAPDTADAVEGDVTT